MYVSRVDCADDAMGVDPVEMIVGRRTARRLTVELPARLQVDERACDVLVEDVSATGARLQLSGPPGKGAQVRLIWEDLAYNCRVIWSADDACGVQFDEQVSLNLSDRRDPGLP